MASRVRTVRASDEEWECWHASAERSGNKLNRWIRKALDGQAQLETALFEEEQQRIAERERIRRLAFPQEQP